MEPGLPLGARLAAQRHREGTSCGWHMMMVLLTVGWFLVYHTYRLHVQPGHNEHAGDAATVVSGMSAHQHGIDCDTTRHDCAKRQLMDKLPTRSADAVSDGTVAQLAFVTYCVKTHTFGNDFGRYEVRMFPSWLVCLRVEWDRVSFDIFTRSHHPCSTACHTGPGVSRGSYLKR
jgi:hypothetical protein